MQSQLEFSYYPGCSVEGMNKSYDKASRLVCEALDINLAELNDWNCCGATSYMAINEQRAHLLSARNLALAEKEKKDLVVVCPACLTTLTKTNRYMGEDPKLKRTINSALSAAGLQYQGGVRVRHLLEVIVNEVGEARVKSRVRKSLMGLMVAPYYGCQLTRPFGEIDDKEFPTILDKLLSWLGAKPVAFPMKTKCCGGMLMMTNEDVALRLDEKPSGFSETKWGRVHCYSLSTVPHEFGSVPRQREQALWNKLQRSNPLLHTIAGPGFRFFAKIARRRRRTYA